MPYHCTLTERDDAILRVVLNRPEKLNALNLQLVAELFSIAAAVRNDPSIRCVLLTAAGRAFCTGADLKDTTLSGNTGQPSGAHVEHTLRTAMNPMIAAWYRLPVPVVVAVNGFAAGAGVSLALAGDIVIATEGASLSLPFIPKLGILPDMGATFGLSQRLGAARLKGLALLGHELPARTAAEWGLIWDCVEDAAFNTHASAISRQLARGPTSAIVALKTLLADGNGISLEAQLEREAHIQGTLVDHPNFREGLAAFRQKREALFRGR